MTKGPFCDQTADDGKGNHLSLQLPKDLPATTHRQADGQGNQPFPPATS